MARAVHESFEAPIELDGIALNVEVSIGIAIAGERGERSYALLQRAGSALTRARAHRRNNCNRCERRKSARAAIRSTPIAISPVG